VIDVSLDTTGAAEFALIGVVDGHPIIDRG
jgi:hypothetical protein